MEKPRWDLFVCHASEDKAEVVHPLANLLSAYGLRVWVDETEISLGDSLRQRIDEGLAHSRFGVVILSPSFFAKAWTQAELGALFGRDLVGGKVLLPIWHRVSVDEVRRASPLLADRRAVSTAAGLDAVAREIHQTIIRAGPRYRPDAPLFAGRLTKKAFMSLPDGSYLMSNIMGGHAPRIAQETPPLKDREAFWQKLRAENLSLTRFYAFADVAEYRTHVRARHIYSAEDE